jgi:hypothetical protein
MRAQTFVGARMSGGTHDRDIPDTLTRTELLRARGYSDEVLNGHNGHSNGAAPPRAAEPETSAPLAANGAEPACAECGKPIPASRASNAVTCSPECQAARHKTLQAGRNPRRADQARQRRASINGALVPPGQTWPAPLEPLAGASPLQADAIFGLLPGVTATVVTERTLSVAGFDPIRTREAQTFQWVPVTNPKEPQ